MDYSKGAGSMCSEAHYAAARRIGDEGIVLLRNERSVLPVVPRKGGRILVVGENAVKMMTVGGGSSSLKAQREVSPLEGIRAAAAKYGMDVEWVRGYVGDVTGEYNGVVTGQDLNDSRTPSELISEAVSCSSGADYVIFVGGLNKSPGQDCEDADRTGLGLPYGQDDVIGALARATRNLVVVNVSGNAVAMPWVRDVPAIVQAWLLGSEAGNSIADVIFGEVNPSGKLPVTFEKRREDNPAYPYYYDEDGDKRVSYGEGLLVGYRHYDTKGVQPNFAFGFGKSYTTFRFSDLKVKNESAKGKPLYNVSFNVTNTGTRDGKEVAQVYIRPIGAKVFRPYKELKGYDKKMIKAGETVRFDIRLDAEAFAYYKTEIHDFGYDPGEYEILVGNSSDNILLRKTVKIK